MKCPRFTYDANGRLNGCSCDSSAICNYIILGNPYKIVGGLFKDHIAVPYIIDGGMIYSSTRRWRCEIFTSLTTWNTRGSEVCTQSKAAHCLEDLRDENDSAVWFI